MPSRTPLPRLLRSLLATALVLPLAAAPQSGPAPKAPKASKAAAAKAQLPPLLDRELFFGNPEIAGAQISPDGQYIAFLKPWKDTRNVWVKKVGEPYSAAKLLTAEPKRPIGGFFWSRDGKRVLFVKDKDGDENFNVWAVDPAAAAEAGQEAPAAKNLTDAKNVRASIYSLPKTDPDTLYVGLNDRDAAWHDLYKVKLSTGERTLLRKNTERISAWIFDQKGTLRLAMRITDKGDTEILRVDPDTFTKVYTCSIFENAAPVRFHKDGKRFYMITNKGDRDLSELVLFDPETGKEELVERDPKGRVDFGGAFFSELTDELILTQYEDDKTRPYFHDKAWEADYKLLQKKLPGREIGFGGMTKDERMLMVSASSDTDPGTRYLFDRKTKKLTLEYVSRDKLPREHMAAMQPIRYKSSDGLEIPAYLTLPKGVPAKNLPLVMYPHGGPWARDSWGFDNGAQFLANRGYAVLQMNFRGSTGYGKKFLNAGNNQWGDKMQDDITWGVKHLVAQGIADPKRVAIMGGSYGGYATLAGVTFTPDLYAAAVSIVGPSNLLTLLETIPPYWEAGRIVFHKRMGDPTNPEGKKQLERQSPLNHAAKIKTPLMVVQGANDPRVKKAESDQIVIALRDRNYPVEYLCAADEGHGFQRPVNNMAMFTSIEHFLSKHLKGRFQPDAKPEVEKRLGEITVDVKTVKLAPKFDHAAVTLPKPVAALVAGTRTYAGTLAVQGREMPVSSTRVIQEDGNAWSVLETVKLPMGEMSDQTRLAKDSLAVQQRTVKQGPVTIEMAFANGKATGSMAMGSAPKAIEASLDGDLYADGAGSDEALARLPLAEGYTVLYRTFDIQKQKVAVRQLKVLGVEEVTVPAGSAKTWKAEITSPEGEPGSLKLWIAQDSRKVLKSVQTLPQMGGAVVTLELQP